MAKQQKEPGRICVLSVVWFKVLPPLFGGQKGVALFNEYLGRLVPLTCLCSKNNRTIPASYRIEASLPVSKTQFLNPLSWRKILSAAQRTKATHLILEFPYYGLAGVLLKKWFGQRLIVHAHNMEGTRFRDQRKRWWRLLQVYEKWTLKNADAIFFKTKKDREFAVAHWKIKQEKTIIVPYGIEIGKKPDKAEARAIILQRHGIAPETKLFLFAGTLDYGPNAAAVAALKENVIPLLNQSGMPYKILVCGRIVDKKFSYLRNMQEEHLLYAGNVADIDRYFAAADVFLNPVTIGGGVQTKMVEALRFDLNVVCFAGMHEGIRGADSKMFIAPGNDWTAFAAAISKAVADSKPTPAAFFDCHNWTNIAENTYRLIQTI